MKGLILLGHGSGLPHYREVIEKHRKRIEDLNLFDEVMSAFVVEKPDLFETLEVMKSDVVFVVPIFIAYGQHLDDLIKSLGGKTSKVGGKVVHICDPIGEDVLITHAIIMSVFRRSFQSTDRR